MIPIRQYGLLLLLFALFLPLASSQSDPRIVEAPFSVSAQAVGEQQLRVCFSETEPAVFGMVNGSVLTSSGGQVHLFTVVYGQSSPASAPEALQDCVSIPFTATDVEFITLVSEKGKTVLLGEAAQQPLQDFVQAGALSIQLSAIGRRGETTMVSAIGRGTASVFTLSPSSQRAGIVPIFTTATVRNDQLEVCYQSSSLDSADLLMVSFESSESALDFSTVAIVSPPVFSDKGLEQDCLSVPLNNLHENQFPGQTRNNAPFVLRSYPQLNPTARSVVSVRAYNRVLVSFDEPSDIKILASGESRVVLPTSTDPVPPVVAPKKPAILAPVNLGEFAQEPLQQEPGTGLLDSLTNAWNKLFDPARGSGAVPSTQPDSDAANTDSETVAVFSGGLLTADASLSSDNRFVEVCFSVENSDACFDWTVDWSSSETNRTALAASTDSCSLSTRECISIPLHNDAAQPQDAFSSEQNRFVLYPYSGLTENQSLRLTVRVFDDLKNAQETVVSVSLPDSLVFSDDEEGLPIEIEPVSFPSIDLSINPQFLDEEWEVCYAFHNLDSFEKIQFMMVSSDGTGSPLFEGSFSDLGLTRDCFSFSPQNAEQKIVQTKSDSRLPPLLPGKLTQLAYSLNQRDFPGYILATATDAEGNIKGTGSAAIVALREEAFPIKIEPIIPSPATTDGLVLKDNATSQPVETISRQEFIDFCLELKEKASQWKDDFWVVMETKNKNYLLKKEPVSSFTNSCWQETKSLFASARDSVVKFWVLGKQNASDKVSLVTAKTIAVSKEAGSTVADAVRLVIRANGQETARVPARENVTVCLEAGSSAAEWLNQKAQLILRNGKEWYLVQKGTVQELLQQCWSVGKSLLETVSQTDLEFKLITEPPAATTAPASPETQPTVLASKVVSVFPAPRFEFASIWDSVGAQEGLWLQGSPVSRLAIDPAREVKLRLHGIDADRRLFVFVTPVSQNPLTCDALADHFNQAFEQESIKNLVAGEKEFFAGALVAGTGSDFLSRERTAVVSVATRSFETWNDALAERFSELPYAFSLLPALNGAPVSDSTINYVRFKALSSESLELNSPGVWYVNIGPKLNPSLASLALLKETPLLVHACQLEAVEDAANGYRLQVRNETVSVPLLFGVKDDTSLLNALLRTDSYFIYDLFGASNNRSRDQSVVSSTLPVSLETQRFEEVFPVALYDYPDPAWMQTRSDWSGIGFLRIAILRNSDNTKVAIYDACTPEADGSCFWQKVD